MSAWVLDVDLALFRRQEISRTNDDIDHRRIYASPELNFYIASPYESGKISQCFCCYFIWCFTNVILTYDFICIVLSLFLEIPLCSYHFSHEHYLYPCVLCNLSLTIVDVFICLCVENRGLAIFWC